MKKIIGFIICTLLITATGFSVVGTDENRDELNKKYTTSNLEHSPPLTGLFEWPMFYHDLNHTGYSPSLAPDDNNVLWTANIGEWSYSPPVVADDKVYVGAMHTGGGYLYCFNAFSGKQIWMSEIHDEFWGCPSIVDNRIYILCYTYNLYCIDADTGSIKWSYPEYGGSSPAVVDNRVYFGSYRGGFYCLNATTGDKIWDFDISTDYEGCSPAVVNGKVLRPSTMITYMLQLTIFIVLMHQLEMRYGMYLE